MLIRGWELSRLFENEAEGAGESAAGGGDAGGSTATVDAAPKGEYSVTDPGYEGDFSEPEPVEDELAALKAENTKKIPADDKSADAGSDAEESGEASAKPTGESAEVPEGEGFSDALLDRAAALGYTFEDIKGFRSEKSLEKEITRVERLQQRMQGRQTQDTQQEPPAQANAINGPDFTELDQMVADGYVDERVANWHKQAITQAWQEAQRARMGVQQMAQAEQQRQFDAQVQRFDSAIASLGDEYESLFGKGSMAEVKRQSPELAQKRVEVFRKFQQLKDSYLMAKQPLPPERELIEEAVHARFWKQTKTLARTELKNDIKKAGSQALSRPRSTGTKQLTGSNAALAKEQDFWKKFN